MKWKVGSDSMELLRIGHFLLTRINVLPLESMRWELKKKVIKRFCLPMNFVGVFPLRTAVYTTPTARSMQTSSELSPPILFRGIGKNKQLF